ncbi:MAG: 2-amino-4-hydroxy-6-hydroxymethyldihydropteridine diphosphokinase [Muribaculaceae bacterium]|nr:2-amino-4-hydroxy-6-hydroxymethyldihydropteridine diphosphokinase [Muribaculaceae bacterium]
MDRNLCKVVLSLGSNYADRVKSVEKAREWLFSILDGAQGSDIYETPPLGSYGSNYMNCVVAGYFKGDCAALEKLCKSYERANGRDEESRLRNIVPIDIDVVVADDSILRPKDFSASFFRIGYNSIL